MAEFVAPNPDVLVSGSSVLSVIEGLAMIKNIAIDILNRHNITDLKFDNWYKQQDWLDSFKEVSERIGSASVIAMGKKIPETALLPPDIDSIEKALSSLEIAYQMNHKLDGQVMYDANTGLMIDGIGHYFYNKLGDRKVEMVCDNPYPCDFDRGIIDSMARKFEGENSGHVHLEHDDEKGCRKNGADSCTYIVSW